MTDHLKYMHKKVNTLRGAESRSIAKWQKRGWELVEQETGRVRTTLHFRRPIPWKLAGAAAAGLVVLVAASGIASAVGGGDEEPAKAAVTPSETVSASESPSDTPSVTPSETVSETPTSAAREVPQVLTPANSKEFGKLMRDDYCSGAIGKFAKEYPGHQVAFDGSVVNVARVGGGYDITLGFGDKGPNTIDGPVFKYAHVSMSALNFAGGSGRVAAGDLLHIVATVGHYEANQCLFYLDPV